jgi:hypothetical protein
VRAQCKTLVVLALFIPQDRKAFADWIKGNTTEEALDDLLAALPPLKLGEGFVIAPQLGVLERRKFPPIRTWDSMRAPEEGEAVGPDTWMAVDLDAVRAEMGEIVREAEENDPARLKAEIARLKSEIRKQSVAPTEAIYHSDSAELAAAEQRGYASAIAAIQPLMDDIDRAHNALPPAISAITEANTSVLEAIDKAIERIATGAHAAASKTDVPRRAPSVALLSSSRDKRGAPNGNQDLTTPQLRVLRGLKWWVEMGQSAVTRPQLAAVIGWSVRSSNLRDRLGELRRGGFIITDGGFIKLSAAGAKAAPEPSVARTVVDSARAILSIPQLRVFDAIPPAGRAIHRNDLCEVIGWSPTSSNIRDRLGELRGLGLIVQQPDGHLARADWVR